MINGVPGWRGYYLSAYGLAVKHGFQGTEEEWLQFLKAGVEMAYENGKLGWKNKDEDEFHWFSGFDELVQELEEARIAADGAAADANTAAANAEAAATAANTAAGSANEKAQAAEEAASFANTSAGAANTAAGNANTAAENANAAKESANTAATNANEKARAAEEAATATQNATTAAKTAAQNANLAAQQANKAKEAADTATESANTAAQGANTAATNANTATETANAARDSAASQAAYAKEQGDRAKVLSDKLEGTDIGGLAADVLDLQTGKADLENGKVVSSQLPEAHDSQVARVVVGCVSGGWTAGDCDVLCDGTGDAAKITAVIDGLSSSLYPGEVFFLSGEYKLEGPIEVYAEGITLRGEGNTAKLVRGWSASTAESTSMIVTYVDGVTVEGLWLDGVKASYGGKKNCGIYTVNRCIQVRKCRIENCGGIGICVESISNPAVQTLVCDNYVKNCSVGICMRMDHGIVSGNLVEKCLTNGIEADMGYFVVVAGNVIADNRQYQIWIANSGGTTITGNFCGVPRNVAGAGGICMEDAVCTTTVAGNTVLHGDGVAFLDSQTSISLSVCENCLVTGNMIYSKDVTATECTGCLVANNKV